MTGIGYYLFALFLIGLLVWEFISGSATGRVTGRISREDNRGLYWFVMAVQVAILVLFLVTGRRWHVR
jgi:cell division protein FtsW (lipid II flippase)